MSNLTLNLAPALKAHCEEDVDACLQEPSVIRDQVPNQPNQNPSLVPAKAEFGTILMHNHRHREAHQHLKEVYQLQPDLDEMVNLIHDAPLWQGESLHEKTLLIQTESGYGDQIMFIRYARWVKEVYQPEKITVITSLEMLPLLQAADGVDEVITDLAGGSYDYQVPLLNLPKLHKTTPGSIPYSEGRYIWPEDGRYESWEPVFETEQDLIGINWRTNPMATEESHDKRIKSMDCENAGKLIQHLRSLFPAARLISLQPAATLEEQSMLARLGVEDIWRYPLRNFADTAAIIEHMDLVVSIDTAIPHLAGALATPVWLLLPYFADWRWSQDEEFSRWYPDMRLFRQSRENNWDTLDLGNWIGQVQT